jgi:hypothetical protein
LELSGFPRGRRERSHNLEEDSQRSVVAEEDDEEEENIPIASSFDQR